MVLEMAPEMKGCAAPIMQYYYLLSANITINGSDEEEIFVISGKGHQLLVSVFSKDKPGQKIYERLFDPAETYCIQLNGLKGNDHFMVEASAGSGIRLQIHGNKGNDMYDIQGKMKIKIYDDRKEDNMVVNNTSARLCF